MVTSQALVLGPRWVVEGGKSAEVGLLDEILGLVVVPAGVPCDAVDDVEVRHSCLEEGSSLVVHMARLDRIGPWYATPA